MSLDQTLGVIMLGRAFVFGVYLMIEDRGGWTLFWAELKRKHKK